LASDTLIGARQEIEILWVSKSPGYKPVLTTQRLLFFDLPKDDVDTDFRLGLPCIELAVNYILAGIVRSWEKLLEKCDDHMSILVRFSMTKCIADRGRRRGSTKTPPTRPRPLSCGETLAFG
jgi:hypothetical protein